MNLVPMVGSPGTASSVSHASSYPILSLAIEIQLLCNIALLLGVQHDDLVFIYIVT